MNTQMKKLTLSRNQTGPGRGISAPCQPPKNRITMSADISTKIRYSLIMKKENRMPLYSVWYPAPRSPSASGRSKGILWASAMAATKKTKKPSGW